MALSTAQPKPVKRRTEKRKRDRFAAENIAIVRESVMARDLYRDRIVKALVEFGFSWLEPRPLELAHIKARGMGGNPDLSRDTTDNTISTCDRLHRSVRSLHSGHLKIRALTDKGADGPCCFEFYEQLPTEVK